MSVVGLRRPSQAQRAWRAGVTLRRGGDGAWIDGGRQKRRARFNVGGWLAMPALAGAPFAAMALTAPPRRLDVEVAVAVAAGLSGLCSVFTLVRGRRIPGVRRALLGLGCLALSGLGAALAVQPPGGALDQPHLDRTAWLVMIGAVAVLAVAAALLVAELRTRSTHIADLGRTDHLTGVANRRAWDDELPRECARARRDGTPMSIALIDVDQLHAFNDLRGHAAGDALLRRIAAAWSATTRATDLLARIEGGRFGLLLRCCPLERAVEIVERLRICMPEAQTASAGVASWNTYERPEDVVARAESALQSAKLRGRDRIAVATAPTIGADELAEDWTSIVRGLVDRHTVVSVYQPIVELASGKVLAYEALARPDPQLVDISVERMFSTAQRMGLARELDWICRRAALRNVSWLPRGNLLFLNCNAGMLIDPLHRVDQMVLMCDAAGLDPRDLVLEITERELAGDLRRLRSVVDAYRHEGLRFAVDDVGEGHSTLEVLAAVRPEFIKVARSLVIEAGNTGARAAIRAVVAFARESGARVVAEGIELPQSATAMRDLGVDLAQGFLFGRPAIPSPAAA